MVDPRDRLAEVWRHKQEVFGLLDVYSRGETLVPALIGSVDTRALFVECDLR
ncbi:MAG: hypothetical protein HXY40_04375 [Chloroflexi bacterium]|nr:hypothetical protein [Chloroflexota bacterium]